MDNNIRQLLAAAIQQPGSEDGSFLQQAYNQLKTVAQSKANADGTLPLGQDLYVLCAEIAIERGQHTLASDCLKMFFLKTPPANQFLCRAYLCHAQLLAPSSADDKDQLEKAVGFIVKAISFAKANQRYHFLVYNASVLYWQFCRPFLKPTYRQFLSVSLHSVVKALDDIDDKDYEWRAKLMIALIECHIDAGHMKEAGEVSKVTADFTKANVPNLYRQVLALQVRHNLVDLTKLAKDLKQTADLTIFYRIMKLRVGLEQGEVADISGTIAKLIGQILREEDVSRPSSVLSTATGKKTPADDRGRQTKPVGDTASPEPISDAEQPALLLELAHLCSEFDQPELLKMCLDSMKTLPIKDQTIYLSMEFLECESMVRNLGFAQEMYTKNSVEVRLQAIERLSEAITNSVRSGDPDIIQTGCVTMWNVCLPLLQSNIRKQIRKPLTMIAEALESINSLLILFRCQLHTELAKIEEDVEQIEVAMDHLKKAIGFDDGGQYSERLQTSLHRLELRAELYKTPDRIEDKAAMIIEQTRKSAESGTVRMKRSLLVQAGQALSPDAFLIVLESESETKGSGGRGADTLYSPLGAKAEHFKKCVKKAAGHIKRYGTENDRERARLWADLAKTARKQEVWDVCRVAARFCLLYDDNRWHMPHPPTRAETRQESALSDQPPASEITSKRGKSASQQSVTEIVVPHSDKDLIRMLAEIHFLNAEALVHLLRSQNVDLKNQPIPPVDTSKKPKGFIAKKPEEVEDWINYREWIANLSESSLQGFLRAAELGVQLKEPWIVCSSTAYVWNYCSHILAANRHREMVPYFTTLLNYLKQIGHAGETSLLVNLCNALAIGLMKPWIPTTPQDAESPSPSPRAKGSKEEGSVKKAKSVTSHTSTKSKTVLTDPEAAEELKKALEVCDYGLNASCGSRDVIVPIAVKHALLITWVQIKQLLSQQVTKTLGSDDESNTDGQTFITRCLVALEMLTVNGNGLMSFKEAPILEELCNMVDDCQWPDSLVELQVWTRMSQLALKSRNHPLVMRCSEKALTFDIPERIRRLDSHKQMVWYEMLSHAGCLLGQSYILVMQGKNATRRLGLEAFVKATNLAVGKMLHGLVLLGPLLKQSSSEQFQENCPSWLRLLTQILQPYGNLSHQRLAASLVKELLEECVKHPDITRKVANNLLQPLLEKSLQMKDEQVLCGLDVLEGCMKYFPGPCGPMRNQILNHVIQILGQNENSNVVEAGGRCFALLPSIGGGGTGGIVYQEAWVFYMTKLMRTVEGVIFELYKDYSSAFSSKVDPDKLIPLPYPPSNEPARTFTLAKQIQKMFHTMTELLQNPFPVAVNIPLEDILSLICNTLAVQRRTLIMSGSVHASHLLMVLPSVYESALKLLRVLVMRCSTHLLPHGSVFNQLILQTLNWTSSTEAGHNYNVLKFRNLRCHVYEVYMDWLNTVGMGAFMGEKSDRLMDHLSNDACLQEILNMDSEPTKSFSSESTGSRRKKPKKQHQWNATSKKERSRSSGIGEQTEKLCLLALKVLRRLFFTCGTRLKWTLHRNYHTAAMRVLLQYQNGLISPSSPYHYSANCRKELYHALLASLLVPSPHWSAPLQSSICVFSQGRLDNYAVVKEFCSEAAVICENIIHPKSHHISTPTITGQTFVKANDEFSSFKLSQSSYIGSDFLRNVQSSFGITENQSVNACETVVTNDLPPKREETTDVDETTVDETVHEEQHITTIEEPENTDKEVSSGKDAETDLQDSKIIEMEALDDENDDRQKEMVRERNSGNGGKETSQEKTEEENMGLKEESNAIEIDNEEETRKRKAEFSDEEENESKEPTIDDMLATFSTDAPDEDQ